jgi:glycosyltransferase involved in cell wall biosynthesis
MKVLAILATRNEENYINYCLKSLIEQKLDVYLIDNDSDDKTVEIAKKYLGKGLIGIDSKKHKYCYEFLPILKRKEQLAQQLNYDWFMHVDADEIYEAPKEYENLCEGIKDADDKGYNVINFEEFVFYTKK